MSSCNSLLYMFQLQKHTKNFQSLCEFLTDCICASASESIWLQPILIFPLISSMWEQMQAKKHYFKSFQAKYCFILFQHLFDIGQLEWIRSDSTVLVIRKSINKT